MNQPVRRVQWQNAAGQPVTVGEVTVTPHSQALVVRLPFAGWVWNRPVAIDVEQGGEVQRLPIVDVTRVLLWGLMALSAACWLGFMLAGRRKAQGVK